MTQKRVSPERSRRTRGGQPGNQNARTHGYYSRTLTHWQRQTLRNAAGLKGTDRETAQLCLKISSVLAVDPYNYPVLKLALSSLARLLQARLPDDGQLEDTLRKLLDLAKRLAFVEAMDRHFTPQKPEANQGKVHPEPALSRSPERSEGEVEGDSFLTKTALKTTRLESAEQFVSQRVLRSKKGPFPIVSKDDSRSNQSLLTKAVTP